MAFFLDPNPDVRVELLQSSMAPGIPTKYRPATGDEYLQGRLTPKYDHL